MISTRQTWQKENMARIAERIAPVRALEDGTLFAEASGEQFVVVTKEKDELRLWLHDEANANTGVIQSELDLADPLQLVDPYVQAVFLGLLWQPEPKHIFTTGLGGGCFPTYAHHQLPDTVIQCVESEAMVAEAAQRFFGFETDATLQLAIDDGRAWLEHQPHRRRNDIIFADVFQDDGAVPPTLTSREWFQLCRDSLTEEGVLIVNLLYLDPFRTARIKTVDAVFDHVYLLAMHDDNDVLFASRRPLPDEATRIDIAAKIQATHRFPFPFARRAVKMERYVPEDAEVWELSEILVDGSGMNH